MTTESEHPAENDGTPKEGDIVAGKYRVERVLGKGGMGVVVAAQHTTLRQMVAVKFLLPEAIKRQGAVERFLREARAAVAIKSEHIARVLDVGTLETGAPYMVMEYLVGHDLGDILRERGTLPIPEAIDYLLQASEAIAEAHALGIIHRDLKPANLFLTKRADGTPLVKVLDFGLSKITKSDVLEASLTAAHVIMGSPFYMSPEQVRSLKGIDSRADVWALGVILYQLVSGRRPFDSESLGGLFLAIGSDPPPSLRAHAPHVPPALEAVIMRCLEKDLALRTSSVGELARALAPFGSEASHLSVERILRVLPDGAPLPKRPSIADTDASSPSLLDAAQRAMLLAETANDPAPPVMPSARPPADSSGSVKATTGEGMSNTVGNMGDRVTATSSRAPAGNGRRSALLILGAAAVIGVAGGLAAVRLRAQGQDDAAAQTAQAAAPPPSASLVADPPPAPSATIEPAAVPAASASAASPAASASAPATPASATGKPSTKPVKGQKPVKKTRDPLDRWR